MNPDKTTEYNFAAPCSAGLEGLVAGEIRKHGGDIYREDTGLVCWKGDISSGYKTCLWSRFASRILLELHSFPVSSNDDIYAAALQYDWSVHLNTKKTFSIDCTLSSDAAVSHNQYASLKLKDGISDFFRKLSGERPSVQKEHSDVRFHLHIEKEKGTLFLDFSGDALHKRGYRENTGIAPIKENVAAALVTLCGWTEAVESDCFLIDPMCGSGTLLIEAALIFGNVAPGLSRKYYGFEKWLQHDAELWSGLVNEAIESEDSGYDKKWPKIIGYDCDRKIVTVARKNVIKAGLQDKIEIFHQDMAFLPRLSEKGFVISNLPYGERLATKSEIGFIYGGVSRILKKSCYGWQMGMLISEPDYISLFSCENQNTFKIHNGPLLCRLVTGKIDKEEEWKHLWGEKGKAELQDGVDLYNRLAKNAGKRLPWAEKNGISCFRIYDRDLPEYNFTVDIFEKYLLVQEYASPSGVKEEDAKRRFSVALHVIRSFFDVGRERVFVRKRKRQRGREQYQKTEGKTKYYQVHEGKCCFLVNFTNYLDVGLFLDHRPVRRIIGEVSAGKKMLNLFAYTGTASVHAAMNGAQTTTVDLSGQYLQWAKNNFYASGLSVDKHQFVQQDCLSWLRENRERFDVIFIDPPTFSNTKKKGLLFDVQKDHIALLTLAGKHLSEEGVLLFSTNYRSFSLDKSLEALFCIKDITKETIPPDFARSASIHKCWEMRKREGRENSYKKS